MPDKIEVPLSILLMEIKGTEIRERVDLYVKRVTNGFTFQELLETDILPDKEKIWVQERLAEILLAKDYSRLPEIQAETSDLEAPDLTRDDIRRIVRQELAAVLETIARVLKE